MVSECKRCRWRDEDECVNVGVFQDGDCLQYKNDCRERNARYRRKKGIKPRR